MSCEDPGSYLLINISKLFHQAQSHTVMSCHFLASTAYNSWYSESTASSVIFYFDLLFVSRFRITIIAIKYTIAAATHDIQIPNQLSGEGEGLN